MSKISESLDMINSNLTRLDARLLNTENFI